MGALVGCSVCVFIALSAAGLLACGRRWWQLHLRARTRTAGVWGSGGEETLVSWRVLGGLRREGDLLSVPASLPGSHHSHLRPNPLPARRVAKDRELGQLWFLRPFSGFQKPDAAASVERDSGGGCGSPYSL